jgi:Holliday junction resolvase RusA-like endonuclease
MVRFQIPGRPVAKQRARTVNGHTYTPPKTRAYEEAVAMLARSTRESFIGDVHVLIDLTSKTKLRGDIDNYAKSILDGIVKGGLIVDDRDIIHLCVSKILSDDDYVQVTVHD